jgi:DNA gyrase inhibitor GyrI
MNAKRMIYLLVAVVICGLAYTAWKLTSRSAYESAEYSVLETDGSIEIRDYPDLMLAATEMGSRTDGGDGSFGRLFRYISGGNENKQKVAMTTPVFMEPKSENAAGQMAFVIPKEVAEASIPKPASNQVEVTQRPGGKFAVIRFAGSADAETRKPQLAKLEAWVSQQGLTAEGEPEMASYDPPWTPGPLRRNEILIRIEP